MLPSVTDIQKADCQAIEALKPHAQEASVHHGHITPMSELLAKVPENTAKWRYPSHLNLQALVRNPDKNCSNIVELRIELPSAHRAIRPFLDDDGFRGLGGLLNLPWDRVHTERHGASPFLQGGLRTSYALKVDVDGHWPGKEDHTLQVHVDHLDGVARALTVFDQSADNFPARVLFDTATPNQRSRTAETPTLNDLPLRPLMKVVNALPLAAASALVKGVPELAEKIGAVVAARERLDALVPAWIHDTCVRPTDSAPATLQGLTDIATGPYGDLLDEVLANNLQRAVTTLKIVTQAPERAGLEQRLQAPMPAVLGAFLRRAYDQARAELDQNPPALAGIRLQRGS